ncbi:MAG TPA: LysR family transcriptional regulator [Dehalococcoidia bacterium]|nr:LysR family transcriptional regulator [Dehalococcoidia bacterium]
MTEKLAQDEDLGVNTHLSADPADLKLRLKVWVERKGEVVMSDWRMALLEAIARTGSLAKAAEELGVPYRSAWQKIKESEERLGTRLIDTRSGGADGGSSQLTEAANDLLRSYRHLSEGLAELVDRRFKESFG